MQKMPAAMRLTPRQAVFTNCGSHTAPFGTAGNIRDLHAGSAQHIADAVSLGIILRLFCRLACQDLFRDLGVFFAVFRNDGKSCSGSSRGGLGVSFALRGGPVDEIQAEQAARLKEGQD